ncbi:MAG: glycosyltransferase [Bacteroidota bacterium]
MKKKNKEIIKNGLAIAKKITKSNKHSNELAIRAKKALMLFLNNDPKEIYNVDLFYPTIKDYYEQLNEPTKKNDPLISILMPTYNTPETYLRESIESIIIQSYKNWELCIADDSSTTKNVSDIIEEYQKKDNRIKLIKRKVNGHISEATNSALKIASGEFIALMDHDDVLWPNALHEFIKVIRKNRKTDFIYSDEDKIDESGRIHSYPFLKPDFSPEFLESCNYITHFSCIRRSLVNEIGGLRVGYEGAQDWDLFIRISEKTKNIYHISKLLYSWRIHEASTAFSTDAKPYVFEAQAKLLNDHLLRTGMLGSVEKGIITQHRTIKYEIINHPKILVVVFFDNIEHCQRLILSLLTHPGGIKYDILCASSNIVRKDETEAMRNKFKETSISYIFLDSDQQRNKFKAIAANNIADYYIFIDSQIEIISDNWAKILIADCQIDGAGVVGPVILDTTRNNIFSAGIGLGYGPNGSLNMLQGMPFDDPHYSRGLYAKSRRNVSAVNELIFAISNDSIKLVDSPKTAIELCVELLKHKKRHIYNPYVQAIVNVSLKNNIEQSTNYQMHDKYLNINFDHSNQRLEVKSSI